MSQTLEPGERVPERIHSPGEYRVASSRAPACCGPHLAAPRPGPCGSGLRVSPPHSLSFTVLAISSPAGPAPSVSPLAARNQRKHRLSQPTVNAEVRANREQADELRGQSPHGTVLHPQLSGQWGKRVEKTPHFPGPTRPVCAQLSAARWSCRWIYN